MNDNDNNSTSNSYIMQLNYHLLFTILFSYTGIHVISLHNITQL